MHNDWGITVRKKNREGCQKLSERERERRRAGGEGWGGVAICKSLLDWPVAFTRLKT